MKDVLKKIAPHTELAARIYACTMLTVYGTGKIVGGQFYRNGNLPDDVAQIPLADAAGFDLAWTFFGYSEGYVYFIGLTQIVGALMLLFERTKLLGVATLVPVLLNIIVVDYFFSISTGAMMSAISYFSALCFISLYNREKIVAACNTLLIDSKNSNSGLKKKVFKVFVALVIVAILIVLENEMLNYVGR